MKTIFLLFFFFFFTLNLTRGDAAATKSHHRTYRNRSGGPNEDGEHSREETESPELISARVTPIVRKNFRDSVAKIQRCYLPSSRRAISRIDTVITGSVVVAGYHVL